MIAKGTEGVGFPTSDEAIRPTDVERNDSDE